MACNIQILHVNGIIPQGGANPTQLRVMGMASGCPLNTVIVKSSITGQSGPIPVDPATDRFVVTLQITANPPPVCEVTVVTVEAWCQQLPPPGPSQCYATDTAPLSCCDVINLWFNAFVPAGSLDPTEIHVQGTLLGCSGDKVVVNSNVSAQSPPTTVDPLTGAFSVSLPINPGLTLHCGDLVKISAWCDSNPTTCITETRPRPLDCGPCPRVKVNVRQPVPACVGTPPTQLITLDAVIEIPANDIKTFHWDFGDGSRGTDFPINNTGGTPSTPNNHSEPHPYSIGSWIAKLVVNSPIEGCPQFYSLPVLVQCLPTCPTATVVRVSEGPCVNGKRTVTLEATVTAPGSSAAVGQWDFGYAPPGGSSLGPLVVVPQGQTQSASQNPILLQTWEYPPGTYRACLRWNTTLHPGCQDSCVSFKVTACPPMCDVHLSYSPQPIPCLQSGGSVTVDFEAKPNATTTPAYTGSYTWEVTKAGVSVYKITKAAPTVDPHKFSYPFTSPGSYDVTVTILTPGCNDPTDTDTASPSPIIKSCCPAFVGQLNAQPDPNNPCQWSFWIQVDNPNNVPLTFDWSFQDGTMQTTTGPSTSHTYAPGTVTSGQTKVTLHATGCPDVSLFTPVTLTGCTCPTVGIPSGAVTGCVGPGRTAAVSLSASVSPLPPGTSINWKVTTPSGVVFTKTTTGLTTTDGVADGPWLNTSTGSTGPLGLTVAGAYGVAVTATGTAIPASCPPPAPGTFTVRACTTASGSGSFGCAILLVLSIVLLLLGGIVLVIGLCINVFWVWIVGAAIAVVGLVLFFLWALFCASMTPCTLMWTMECILNWIVKVGLIVAIIVAIIGSKNAACAAGSIAVWGGWGYLDNWLQTIMFKVGCPPIDCTKPRSG